MIGMSMLSKTYFELIRLDSFDDRLNYLLLNGSVGEDTFGHDRYLNQGFYKSREWKSVRDFVIVRDDGCDLGHEGFPIFDAPLVHHMNPMTADDIIHAEEWILDPTYLITTTQQTHNTIHFGYASPQPRGLVERAPGDTKLW